MSVVSHDAWMCPNTLEVFPQPEAEQESGTLDLRVFLQDEFWVNVDGVVFRLEDMTHEYLANVMSFLFRDAEHYHASILEWFAVGVMTFTAGVLCPSEAQRLEFLADAHACVDADAEAWLKSTVLVQRIEQLLNDGDLVGELESWLKSSGKN